MEHHTKLNAFLDRMRTRPRVSSSVGEWWTVSTVRCKLTKGASSFNPPSDQLVEQIKKIVEELDVIVAIAESANAAIDLATELVNEWNKVRV